MLKPLDSTLKVAAGIAPLLPLSTSSSANKRAGSLFSNGRACNENKTRGLFFSGSFGNTWPHPLPSLPIFHLIVQTARKALLLTLSKFAIFFALFPFG